MELNESMFNVDVKIEKNILKCKIIFTQIITGHFEYAFYLLKNEERIDTQYYTINSSTEFKLNNDGEYSVLGFVRYGEKKVIKTSETLTFKFNNLYLIEEKSNKNIIPISIFGSCVSRDILEFDKSKKINLKTYIARQSIESAVSDPIDCDINTINLKSKFQKEMVYNDFTKKTFYKFNNDGSKYLLIDLIDERFDIISYKGSIVTLSNELKSIDFYKNNIDELKNERIYKIKNWKIFKLKKKLSGYSFMFRNHLLEDMIDKFCDKIIRIYGDKNIIIHKAYMLNYYIDKDKNIKQFPKHYIVYNKRINERLKYMYDYLQLRMPNALVIDICGSFNADENHKWGLAPMHYEKEYYLTVYKIIKENIK